MVYLNYSSSLLQSTKISMLIHKVEKKSFKHSNTTHFFEKTVKTINSNNSTKLEVNWRKGSQFKCTARHTKNHLQFDEKSPITLD